MPSDVAPPEGVEERVIQMADYVEDFFGHWMKHWGYEPERPLALDRGTNGVPEILYVRGKHTEASGKYRRPDFQRPDITTYVNGKKVGSAKWDYPVGHRGDMQLGRWSGSVSHAGLIDDVRIYGRACVR